VEVDQLGDGELAVAPARVGWSSQTRGSSLVPIRSHDVSTRLTVWREVLDFQVETGHATGP
jgi:hypothetical protein